MKPAFLVLLFIANSIVTPAQKITYSSVHSGETNRDAQIDILGKVGGNFIMFKKITWRSILQVFDQDMKELSNERLKFVPDNLLGVDFVVYPDYFFMIYQYQKNGVLYCNAAKFDGHAKLQGSAVTLDTFRIGNRSANGIYNMAYSEDKSRILIYKMYDRNDKLNFMAKTFDANLSLKDSVRNYIEFNDRKEVYTPLQISNKGKMVFIREKKGANRENINQLELVKVDNKTGEFIPFVIDLKGKYIDDVNLKIDNLNENYIINSLYYPEKRSSDIEGLFSAFIKDGGNTIYSAVNPFGDSLRAKLSGNNSARSAFNNFFLKNIFVKRDGSFILAAEDFYTLTLGGNNYGWNRWDYLYGYGNPYFYDYNYLYSPYYRFNRFNNFNNYYNRTTTQFYYNDIMVLNVDDSLKITWQNIILKKQNDNEDDNFLSFGTMNTSGEVHFLFIEKDKNFQLISNHSISPYGNIVRYPTVKSREAGFQFMPRLAKQTGVRQIIMPCVFRNNICFAKMDF